MDKATFYKDSEIKSRIEKPIEKKWAQAKRIKNLVVFLWWVGYIANPLKLYRTHGTIPTFGIPICPQNHTA